MSENILYLYSNDVVGYGVIQMDAIPKYVPHTEEWLFGTSVFVQPDAEIPIFSLKRLEATPEEQETLPRMSGAGTILYGENTKGRRVYFLRYARYPMVRSSLEKTTITPNANVFAFRSETAQNFELVYKRFENVFAFRTETAQNFELVYQQFDSVLNKLNATGSKISYIEKALKSTPTTTSKNTEINVKDFNSYIVEPLAKILDQQKTAFKALEEVKTFLGNRDLSIVRGIELTNAELRDATEKLTVTANSIGAAQTSIREDIESTRGELKQSLDLAYEKLVQHTDRLQKEIQQAPISIQKEMRQIPTSIQKGLETIALKLEKNLTSSDFSEVAQRTDTAITSLTDRIDQSLKNQAILSRQMTELTTAILKLQNAQPTKAHKNSSENLIWLAAGVLIAFVLINM